MIALCARRHARAAVLWLFPAGCAASLSGFQPAHVPPAGHVQAEATARLAMAGRTLDVDLAGFVVYPGVGFMGEF